MKPLESRIPVEILIVDDEPQAVKYFQKAFAGKYDVLTATSAEEAEDIIFSDEHDVGVVITDQRMPGRSGVNLLSNIKKRRPDIVRMLSTAYCDLDSAIQAVNTSEIFRYITKPWDLNSLEADLDQAVTFYVLQKEWELLVREKLDAVQRTLLRDRVNSMAAMSSALSGYKNATSTMYGYLKDMLAETAWRSTVKKQWAETIANDHWRLPVEETQRLIGLSQQLMDPSLVQNAETGAETDLVSVISDCAQSLKRAHNIMSVSVKCEAEKVVVPAEPAVLQGIISRLIEPMSQWAATGSTLIVSVKAGEREGQNGGAVVNFEMRNFDPEKAVEACVLHTPPHQAIPERSIEFLRAMLALGHMGGTLYSPPAQNGFKQVQVVIPTSASSRVGDMPTPTDWLLDLNEEYDRWILGMYDLAS